MTAVLETVDLHRSFGTTPALRGVDVSVTEGEILAVMGPSGSGKSTLLHCLAGILPPDQGEVRFAGRSGHRRVPSRGPARHAGGRIGRRHPR